MHGENEDPRSAGAMRGHLCLLVAGAVALSKEAPSDRAMKMSAMRRPSHAARAAWRVGTLRARDCQGAGDSMRRAPPSPRGGSGSIPMCIHMRPYTRASQGK